MTGATRDHAHSYEPPIGTGTLSAAVAVAGVVLAVVSLIAIAFPPFWLYGWWRFAPLALVLFGALLALRFTRDDRNIAGTIARLEMDCTDYEVELLRSEDQIADMDDTIIDLRGQVNHLQALLANPSSTITITDRGGVRTEPLHARNGAWANAVALVRMSANFGQLPGREKSNMTQESQAAAIKVLTTAKIIMQSGNINRLTVPVAKAIDVLNWLAPATPPADATLDASTSRQEVASSVKSSGDGAGEVA